MGKASRIKKEKRMGVGMIIQPKPQKPKMDSTLVEAYVRGRNVGEKQGKIDGYAEAITNYHVWTEDIDKHVKGIGPKMKMAIEEYFAIKMQETIDKNKNNKK